jgi:hypothetical protein
MRARTTWIARVCAILLVTREKALVHDNYGVDPRAPSATAELVSGVESLSAKSDERELIASVLRKDRKAAARLVAAHIDAVYAYARH